MWMRLYSRRNAMGSMKKLGNSHGERQNRILQPFGREWNKISSFHRNYTSKAMLETIYTWAKKPQRAVTLKELASITEGRNLQTATWLREELPVRLAVQVVKLDKLPYGMCLMPSVRKVREWYVQSFEELYNFPRIRDKTDEEQFTKLLEDIYQRHSPTLVLMAKGVHELKDEISKFYFNNNEKIDITGMIEIHQFLDSFFLSRIGIRMLIGQHIEMHKEAIPGHVGLICKKTSPTEIAKLAVDDAKYMCERQHGISPEVEVFGSEKLTFPYVPSHLYYIFFELLKNSTRAVVEHSSKQRSVLPPIKIVIADADENCEDIAIKISDEGGGIPRSYFSQIFSYLYTTAKFNADSETPDFGKESPMAGLGVGLPISRLYARYFGGDLQLMSMEGFGTDAYLHLRRLGDKQEPLISHNMPTWGTGPQII